VPREPCSHIHSVCSCASSSPPHTRRGACENILPRVRATGRLCCLHNPVTPLDLSGQSAASPRAPIRPAAECNGICPLIRRSMQETALVRQQSKLYAIMMCSYIFSKHISQKKKSYCSSVGIATGYRLDDRRDRVRVPIGSRIFTSPMSSRPALGPYIPNQWVPGVKRQERQTDNATTSA
jgi:hypothetical protein